jgi:transposase
MPRARKYPEELLERGARLVFESGRPIAHVAADLGIHPEALRKRVRQAEADAGGRREFLTSSEREELAGLRREVKELRKANEILKAARVFFAKELDPIEVSAFVEERNADFGVEPICRTLGVSASAYYQRANGSRSRRAVEDERLLEEIRRAHEANYECYGSRRVWKALLSRAGPNRRPPRRRRRLSACVSTCLVYSLLLLVPALSAMLLLVLVLSAMFLLVHILSARICMVLW